MKRCKSPRYRSILIVDDNKRRDGISYSVSPENSAGNVCVIAAEISEQQDECARRLYLFRR